MILKQSDVNISNGSVKIINDCVNQYNVINVKTRERNGEMWEKLHFFYGFTNMDNADTLYNCLDDVYLNNSWARVEIGNNSIYGNCTHREIQIPSSWTSTSITITLNQGSFTNGDSIYFFVVDSLGNISNGYGAVLGTSVYDNTAPSASLDLTSTKFNITNISSDTDSSWTVITSTKWDTSSTTLHLGSSNISEAYTPTSGWYYGYWKAVDDSSNWTYFSENIDSVYVSPDLNNGKKVFNILGIEDHVE